jgi:quinol monooxygenase YgiN
MPVFMTARFAVKPESREKCEPPGFAGRAIREFIAYVKANEPETRLYVSLQQAGDPTSFLHHFIFEDAAARERHSNSEGVRRFTGVLYPELLAPVEFTEYTLVAST